MGLVYYKAIRNRLARRRRAVREAALAAERILRGTEDNSQRCECPGCGHKKSEHKCSKTEGYGCTAAGCRCCVYFLGLPT